MIRRIEIQRWQRLITCPEFTELLRTPNVLWRGQEQDWSLTASYYRFPIRFDTSPAQLHNNMIQGFSSSLREIGEDLHLEQEPLRIQLLASQHLGLPTCGLDWTRSPWKALFFSSAVEGTNIDSSKDAGCMPVMRTLHALNMPLSGDVERVRARNQGIAMLRGSDASSEVLQRLPGWLKWCQAQEGVLTVYGVAGGLLAIEDHVRLAMSPDPMLYQFVIHEPDLRSRIELLNFLRMYHNVDYKSLFPDVSGAVRHQRLVASLTGYCDCLENHTEPEVR